MSKTPEPWKARVVSSVTSDTDSAFQVAFGDAKYLFNCPENTTRTFLSRKLGFNKYKGIFLSRVSTETSSGLPGFIMTLADSGTTELKVHGPPGLLHFIASTRSYLIRDNLDLQAFEVDAGASGPIFKDQNITVHAIRVEPGSPDSETGEKEERLAGRPDSPSSLKRKRSEISDAGRSTKRSSFSGRHTSPSRDASSQAAILLRQDPTAWRNHVVKRMFPGKGGPTFYGTNEITVKDLRQQLPPWKKENVATSYLVFGPEFRGKFDAKLANELGVPNGPARRKLTLGESITLGDGRVVTPEMVIGKSSLAAAILIVDCPDPTFIPGLTGSTNLADLLAGKREQLHCVFHMAPATVVRDQRYVQWMESFGRQTHHLVSSETFCKDEISFPGSVTLQKKLSTLDPELFVIPSSAEEHSEMEFNGTSINVSASRHEVIGMRPLLAPEEEVVVAATDGPLLDESVGDVFEGVRAKVEAELPSMIAQPGDDVKISCLGTGSAMPGKYRNVSGLLVQIPGFGNVLLDSGEGTWGQIRRTFGAEASQVLRDIKGIFISHLHADHHIGLSKILSQRRKLSPSMTEPVHIVCTRNTWLYLQEYNELEDLGLYDHAGVLPIFCDVVEHRAPPTSGQPLKYMRSLCENLGLESLFTAEVIHRAKAYGLILKHKSGWSLTYSGDTKPCQNLVDAGKDSTLLIHEATMADDQVEMAEEKTHSTIGQAVDIAKRMNAKKLLLTHFSARYPKIPVLGSHGADRASRTGTDVMPEMFVAFDFLNIRLGDFAKAERYLPNLEAAFEELKDDEIVANILQV